jgi:hypothetical protein
MALEVAPDSCDPSHLSMELRQLDHHTFHSFGYVLSSLDFLSAL